MIRAAASLMVRALRSLCSPSQGDTLGAITTLGEKHTDKSVPFAIKYRRGEVIKR
jgi:hypothetical protein